eukprot:TRINITY_DN67_c0_g3_i1.p1 TRINITY_DN67_c0_g3~~TRINITY_DN67_c0_g3_i1.p1  ORF type:complete len:394 (+),score=46.58 TRINITY_DN67_c0_g3_i1:66-1247(+)
MKQLLVLLVLVGIVLTQSTEANEVFVCQTNTDCSDYGNCVNGTCICTNRRAGADCSVTPVQRFPEWAQFFWTYTAIGAALHLIIVIWCCIALVKQFRSTNFSIRTRRSMSTWALIMLGSGSFLRSFFLLFDPHNMRQISNRYGSAILYNLPILLWIDAGLLLFLYWIELQSRSRLTDLPNVKRYRPILFGFIIASAVVLLPLVIWNMTGTTASSIVYHAAVIIMIVTIVGLCLHSGRRLLSSIKTVMETTKSSQYIIFLRTVTYFIISLMVIFIVIVLTLLIYVGIAGSNQWVDVALMIVLRIEEFGYALTMVLFLDKRRPKSSPSSDGSSDQGSKKDSIQLQETSVEIRVHPEAETSDILLVRKSVSVNDSPDETPESNESINASTINQIQL